MINSSKDGPPAGTSPEPSRRSALTWMSTAAMGGALVAAYGTLAAFIGRFFYPARPAARGWMFVEKIADIAPGDSFVFRLPSGTGVNVVRRGSGGDARDFLALSSTCPHLGCQVHWEQQNARYFCPCHNGVFGPGGQATGGPPGDAGQSLLQYPLKDEGGILFIEVPVEKIAQGPGRIDRTGSPSRAGHDPCLAPERRA